MSALDDTPVIVENVPAAESDMEAMYNALMENGDGAETTDYEEDSVETVAETDVEETDVEESDDDDETKGTDEEEEEADKDAQEIVDSLQTQADACATLLAKSGIDYNEVREEYLENGCLSKATLKTLADAGYSEELIEGYIAGQQARYEVYASHVMNIAGGEKPYRELLAWADKNLSEKEKTHFNKAVDSNDIDEARFAITGLMARREKVKGVKPNIVHGKTAQSKQAVKGYANLAELAKAQRDPRYETDAAYTREVERRILASDF